MADKVLGRRECHQRLRCGLGLFAHVLDLGSRPGIFIGIGFCNVSCHGLELRTLLTTSLLNSKNLVKVIVHRVVFLGPSHLMNILGERTVHGTQDDDFIELVGERNLLGVQIAVLHEQLKDV